MNIGAIITIILVVAWVVKGLASVMGNQEEGEQKRPARSLEDWDEAQAQRRAEHSDQQQALSQMRADSSPTNPAQMTMAERIELARQRARQQAGGQGQSDEQAEALRRARAQAEQKAQQQRQQAQQRAQRERAAQQQAQRERVDRAKQQRRRQAQQEAEQQAKQHRRAKQQRRQPSAKRKPRATTGSKREGVVAQSMQRIHQGHAHSGPAVTKLAQRPRAIGTKPTIGSMNRTALRQAFIMKELLDKPVALRDPQADVLS